MRWGCCNGPNFWKPILKSVILQYSLELLWVQIDDMKYRDMLCCTCHDWTFVKNYQLNHVDKIAALWTWSCQCLWFCLLSVPNHRLQFNTVPHHFTIYRKFLSTWCSYAQVRCSKSQFCENLDKSGFCEWVITPHMARSFSIFLQMELFNVFIPPYSLSESTHLSYLEKSSATNSCGRWLLSWTLNIYIPWRQVK